MPKASPRRTSYLLLPQRSYAVISRYGSSDLNLKRHFGLCRTYSCFPYLCFPCLCIHVFMHRRRPIRPHFEQTFSNSTSASSCFSQRSLKTSSENLFALSRDRRRIAKASDEGSSRALAKPAANCSSVEAWKPVMGKER
jgi:hypothetical protein